MRFPRPHEVDVDTAASGMLLKNARMWRLFVRPVRQGRCGHPPPERLFDPSSGSRRPYTSFNQVPRFSRQTPFDLDVLPRRIPDLGLVRRRSTATIRARVRTPDLSPDADQSRSPSWSLPPSTPEGFRPSRPTARPCTDVFIYRRLNVFPVRLPTENMTRSATPRPLLPPYPAARRSPSP